MPSYGLIDQNAEDNLHAQRLLNFEERPFRRLTKRLLISESHILAPPTQLPTPPLDTSVADEAAAAHEAQIKSIEEQRRQWSDDVLLDFSAFESNVIRVQFLLNANVKERERYAAEKFRIQELAQAVRDTNVELHEQLREAQSILEVRKGYDALADKITNNKALKPRDEQQAAIEKLHAEIAELEHEREEYSKTWAERREQFGRIVDEGMQMLRLIRDEKEEAERQEDMEDMDDDAEASKAGTPRHGTPKPVGDGATPLHPGIDDIPGAGFQRAAEHALSATPVPPRNSRGGFGMPDHKMTRASDITMTNGRDEDGDAHTEIEEGEATDDDDEATGKMDVT